MKAMTTKSGSQRRKGRQVFLYLNSEQYTRLKMAASEHETTPGTFAKEKVLDALGEQTDAEVAEFGEAKAAFHLASLQAPAVLVEIATLSARIEALIDEALPTRPSDGESPAEGFRCTFTDGGYRCALETGHGGIHISPQGYRLAAVKSR